MTLPNDPDVGKVAEERELSLLDEKILTVLRSAEAPVLTSKEVKQNGIRKSRRTVHDHLEDLEQLGLVHHKRAGEGDRTPKVWWFNEEAIPTDNQPPGEETVREGLEAMPSHRRQSLRSEFPEFKGRRPAALRWGTRATLLGVFTAIVAVVIPDPTSSSGPGVFSDLLLFSAGSVFTAGIALGLIHFLTVFEARLGENGALAGRSHTVLRLFKKYAIPVGAVSVPIAILASVAGYPFAAVGDLLITVPLVIAAVGLSVLVLLVAVDAWRDPGYYKEKVVGY